MKIKKYTYAYESAVKVGLYEIAKKVTLEFAKKRFPEVKIVAVELAEDVDHDGDEYLRVGVIYDSRKGELKSKGGTLGFGWRLQKKLSENGIEANTHMSFCSVDDPDIDWWREDFKLKREGATA